MTDIYLQLIANSIFLNHYKVRENGLQNGRIGMVLFLYQYARYKGEKGKVYEELADDLIRRILCTISRNTELDFLTGIAGIGWGIRWLSAQKLIETDEDVLDDLDHIIYGRTLEDCIQELNSSPCPVYSNGLYALSDPKRESSAFIDSDFLKQLLRQTGKQSLPISFLISVWHVYRISVYAMNRKKDTEFEELWSNLLRNSYQTNRLEETDAYLLCHWTSERPEWKQLFYSFNKKAVGSTVSSWKWIVYKECPSTSSDNHSIEQIVKQNLNNLTPEALCLDGMTGMGLRWLNEISLL